jgi:hypothetical protein
MIQRSTVGTMMVECIDVVCIDCGLPPSPPSLHRHMNQPAATDPIIPPYPYSTSRHATHRGLDPRLRSPTLLCSLCPAVTTVCVPVPPLHVFLRRTVVFCDSPPRSTLPIRLLPTSILFFSLM